MINHPKSVTLKQYCTSHEDVTTSAIRNRISRKQWTEGVQYFYDPLKKIHILLDGVEEWKNSTRPPVVDITKIRGSHHGTIHRRRGPTEVNPYKIQIPRQVAD